MKIVFMGTPDFAIPSLDILLKNGYKIQAVVTQPDKPRGRGGNYSFSPVKVFSKERKIRVLQYDKILKDGVLELEALKPDLMITAAYGQLLSQEILDIPKYGVINVHASLLPKYRGAAPVQRAVIDGEKLTGVTIMKTVLALDSGGILLQKETEIGEEETAGQLFERLAIIGAEALLDAVRLIESGKAEYAPQDDKKAVFCKTIKKEDAKISFDKESRSVINFVRGMNPYPTAFAEIGGEAVKVYRAEASSLSAASAKPGDILFADSKNGLVVATLNGAVRLSELKFPNGKRMPDTEYLKGHSIFGFAGGIEK